MWATDKRVKMMNQLEIQQSQPMIEKKTTNLKSIEGRVVSLCLATWYFGYVLTQISLFPNAVWYNSFGQDMIKEYYIGPCFGLIPLGAAVGVIINHFAMKVFTRRIYLFVLSLFSLFFTGALQFGGVTFLFAFRAGQGIVAGAFMNFIPTYISELTPKEYGSRFGVYPQISVVLGVLISYLLGMTLTLSFDYQELPTNIPVQNIPIEQWQSEVFWRVMLGMAALPNIIQIILIFVGYIPESPYSLITKNRKEQAKEVLALFYEEEYVAGILEEKETAIFQETNNNLDDTVNWTCKGYFIGYQLAVFQALTGIASYVTQTGHVIAVTLEQPVFSIYTPIVITLAQLIGTFISVPMLQFIEWKTLTLIGGFALAFFNGIIGLFFFYYSQNQGFQNYAMTLIIACIIGFMFTFGITVGSSAWPYASYMMPSKAILGGQVLNWLLAGASIIAFSVDVNFNNNPYIIIWIYCGVTFFISLLNAFLLINIKNLNVIKVQEKLAID